MADKRNKTELIPTRFDEDEKKALQRAAFRMGDIGTSTYIRQILYANVPELQELQKKRTDSDS
jgi:hypothetical protein